eukprot:751992-Hanusia_phi.AAC.3
MKNSRCCQTVRPGPGRRGRVTVSFISKSEPEGPGPSSGSDSAARGPRAAGPGGPDDDPISAALREDHRRRAGPGNLSDDSESGSTTLQLKNVLESLT